MAQQQGIAGGMSVPAVVCRHVLPRYLGGARDGLAP
jgi:hypothetical protein